MQKWPTLNMRYGKAGVTRTASSFGHFCFLLGASLGMSRFPSQLLFLEKLSRLFKSLHPGLLVTAPIYEELRSGYFYPYNKKKDEQKLKINDLSWTRELRSWGKLPPLNLERGKSRKFIAEISLSGAEATGAIGQNT